jgi:hypothetical protein
MKLKTTQTLYTYWNELRAGRIAPRRLEVEPSRISSVLAETFMLERAAPASYRYRLAGTRLCEIFGTELRDTDVLDGWLQPDRALLARCLASTCTQGAVTLLVLEAGTSTQHRVQLEAILLPLVHGDDDKIDRVIGAMAPTTSPHWLGSEPLMEKRLMRHELLWPDGRPHAAVRSAGGRAPFLASLPQGRILTDIRRTFRVVEGGRGKT